MSLKRSLSLTDSVSLMFSSMVGSGVFFTTGYILQETSNPWLVLYAWALGGLIALSGALTYAYSAKIFPFAGGDYVYLKEAYTPLIAFLSGWTSLTTNFSACISVLALAFSGYMNNLIPNSMDWVLATGKFLGIDFSFGAPQILGTGLILFFSVVNYFGVRSALRIQNFFTSFKIIGLLLMISIGFTFGNTEFTAFQESSPIPNDFSSWKGLVLAIVPVSFSYLGWNMVTYVAEEIQEPEINIGRSVLISCLLVTLLYLGLNFLFLSSGSMDSLKGSEGVGSIAAYSLFGQKGKTIITIFIAWILLGSMSAIIIGGSRIYIAMSRDGLFFPSFKELHPKYHSPTKAIWFQGGIAIAFLFIRDIEVLLYLITTVILLISILTAFTPYIFAKKGLKPKFKLPGHPYTPAIYILANVFIVAVLIQSKPISAIWGFFISLSGIPVYYLFRWRQSH